MLAVEEESQRSSGMLLHASIFLDNEKFPDDSFVIFPLSDGGTAVCDRGYRRDGGPGRRREKRKGKGESKVKGRVVVAASHQPNLDKFSTNLSNGQPPKIFRNNKTAPPCSEFLHATLLEG